jgi:cation diffusion facilitator CzcD-associated flavoprotein CzcO
MTQITGGTDVDVVVVGAGFVGIYAVHRLRDRMGLRVLAIEGGTDVGGTWYWNRYPGCRCDIESVHYSYSFDEDLQRDWHWTERYAAQPEILAYLDHVADRFDVRRSIRFGTRITSMVWDDAESLWRVGTDDGATTTARFVVSGAGNVTIPMKPDFPGLEDFGGEVYATHRWPHDGVDLAGRRVGVIGTGASGIQVVSAIAAEVEHLTVFQRTPNFATPLRNRPVSRAEHEERAASYPEIRREARQHFMGITADPPRPSAKEATESERREVYAQYYAKGGFHLLVSSYGDLLFDQESNDTVADFIRDRIAERVDDPAVAAMLTPRDHPYGTKRAPMETDYYEAFNRENVTLVDVRAHPIEEVTATGIRAGGREHELDVIITAMGYDAFTGALLDMGVVGRDGLTLDEKWADGPATYLGIASHGFPNFFMITGPQSAVALYNNPSAIEDHVEFASDAIGHAVDHGYATIEATAQAEADWGATVRGLAQASLFPRAKSWYMGANIPGKPISPALYLGGAPAYRAICADVVDRGYAGFELRGAPVAAH